MPGLAEGVYAQYLDSVIKMAKTTGGVSRPQIMEKLKVSRSEANSLIDEAKLRRARTVGRTDYFVATKATHKLAGDDDNSNEDNADNEDESAMPGPSSAVEEGQTMVQTAPAPASQAADSDKAAALDKKIKLLKQSIADALEKAKQAQQTVVVQTAHANALGTALESVLKERLAL